MWELLDAPTAGLRCWLRCWLRCCCWEYARPSPRPRSPSPFAHRALQITHHHHHHHRRRAVAPSRPRAPPAPPATARPHAPAVLAGYFPQRAPYSSQQQPAAASSSLQRAAGGGAQSLTPRRACRWPSRSRGDSQDSQTAGPRCAPSVNELRGTEQWSSGAPAWATARARCLHPSRTSVGSSGTRQQCRVRTTSCQDRRKIALGRPSRQDACSISS